MSTDSVASCSGLGTQAGTSGVGSQGEPQVGVGVVTERSQGGPQVGSQEAIGTQASTTAVSPKSPKLVCKRFSQSKWFKK